MGKQQKIHLIHNSILEPFIVAAKQIGTPVEKILAKVNLPMQVLEDQNIFIPERPCWDFIREVSQREGIHDFGQLATEAIPHDEMKGLEPLLAGCDNLFDLLKRFCLVTPTISDTADYIIEFNQDKVILKQRGDRLLTDDTQVQLFEIAGMIQIVNVSTNYQWHPPKIHLTFEPKNEIENSELLGFSQILINQPYPAIEIPRTMLQNSIKIKPAKNITPYSIPENIIHKIQHIITPYFTDQHLDINLTAELVGLSVRTFQRRLNEQDTSFSEIINKTRIQHASILLRENELKLIDISLFLGYKDASSFTRAFYRGMGLSPREYRQLHL